MANLTWSITTTSGTVNQSGPEISEAQMTRFRNWLWANYPQFEADGVTLKTRNAQNEAAAFRDWAAVQWHGTKSNVLRWEKEQAAKTARDGVSDIA